MKVTAKCHNYSGCLKAYRGEAIELDSAAPLVCPECAKPVTIVKSTGSNIAKILAVLLLIGGLGAGAFTFLKKSENGKTSPNGPEKPPQTVAEKPAKKPPQAPEQVTEEPLRAENKSAEPPKAITAPEKIDLNVGSSENKKVKAEVLTRIDVMPNVTQSNKDKLYASVERARSMGKALTIPFGSGKTALANDDVQALKAQLDSPELMKLRDDPTAVFVILGYADPKGDKQKNILVSQTRADSVLSAMREKCGVINVMHSVAMGSSTLLDAENLEKNRIVEIWAVLP